MIQALPLLESGRGRGLTDRNWRWPAPAIRARRCMSEAVARWLADLGLGEPTCAAARMSPATAPNATA
jgi:hypothetical protein